MGGKGDHCDESYHLKTTIHKPLRFDFIWQDDSLASAYAHLESEESVPRADCPNCTPGCCCYCTITTGHYALKSNVAEADSIHAEELNRKDELLGKMDSTIAKLLLFVDSSQHLKFSLKDSTDAIKSYDLDLANVLSYINSPKHYEIRGDSVDIFLPEGNFYVWYRGSCYNGIDNFSDLSYENSSIQEGTCTRYKSSNAPQTISLEIAALSSLYFEVRISFESESNLKTDTFSFRWNYSHAL